MEHPTSTLKHVILIHINDIRSQALKNIDTKVKYMSDWYSSVHCGKSIIKAGILVSVK